MRTWATIRFSWTTLFHVVNIFLSGTMGGIVQLSPIGTAATNRPIVSSRGEYDDGEIGGMIGRGTEVLGEKLTHCRFVHHKPHMLPGSGPPRWEASD
jgi:hypothetical protein